MLIKPVRRIHGRKKAPHGASASGNGHQPEHHLRSFRFHKDILPAIFETLPSLGRQSCQFSRGDRHGLQISPNPCPARLDAIVALFLRNRILVAQQQGYFAIDGIINLHAFILGFPLETLAGFLAFLGLWAIFIHSNVRLPIGPLRMIIGAPELHHWHHDKARDVGNYANISPLVDILFGTYRCPDHEPEAFGIHEPISKHYLGQLWHPFRRRKRDAA